MVKSYTSNVHALNTCIRRQTNAWDVQWVKELIQLEMDASKLHHAMILKPFSVMSTTAMIADGAQWDSTLIKAQENVLQRLNSVAVTKCLTKLTTNVRDAHKAKLLLMMVWDAFILQHVKDGMNILVLKKLATSADIAHQDMHLLMIEIHAIN